MSLFQGGLLGFAFGCVLSWVFRLCFVDLQFGPFETLIALLVATAGTIQWFTHT